MKVIVFGGSGFLGSYVAEELTKANHQVIIFDKEASAYIQDNQEMVIGDILDRDAVNKVIQGADIVYNFAGIADIGFARENPYDTLSVNFNGNLNILQACHEYGIKRYIFASTLYVYSTLGSFYRASKQACELTIESFAERYDLKYTILRFGSLYGPRSNETNWIYKVLTQALTEKKITRAGDGEELREYIHVHDAAVLSASVMAKGFENQYVIISGSQKIKIKDFMIMVKEMLNNDVQLEFTKNKEDSHYEVTPYNFKPRLAKKIESTSHIDLGQGILDLLHHLSSKTSSGSGRTLKT